MKRAGHEVSLLHYAKAVKEQELIADISKEAPDIVGFSSSTHMFKYVKEWAQWVKKHSDIPTICGGIHSTIAPEDAIHAEGIDMICVGEGEEALIELCSKYENGEDIKNIPSIWIKEGGRIIKNPVRPLIENLDTLPLEDREIFDYKGLYASLNYTADVMASRGCSYDCSYCCNPVIKKIYPNKERYARFKSVDNVIEEIRRIVTQYSFIRFIRFFDDILPLNKKWFREFAEKYRMKVGLPFSCQCRSNLMDRETVQLLKDAGCYIVRFGVESGNDYIRNEILNRCITREQIINSFELCREKGILTRANYIIGSPFEDMHSILDSIKLDAQIRPDRIVWAVFYPYPGSKAYNICKEKGFLTKTSRSSLFESPVISQDTLTSEQMSFAFESFPYFVKVYSFCNRLPRFLKVCTIKILDSLYCSKIIPYGLIATLLVVKRRFFYRLTAPIKRYAPRIYSLLKAGRGTKV